MKIKFGFKRGQTVYITLIACAMSLWMLVARFGMPAEKLLAYLLISVGFVLVLILVGALLAFIFRFGIAVLRNNDKRKL